MTPLTQDTNGRMIATHRSSGVGIRAPQNRRRPRAQKACFFMVGRGGPLWGSASYGAVVLTCRVRPPLIRTEAPNGNLTVGALTMATKPTATNPSARTLTDAQRAHYRARFEAFSQECKERLLLISGGATGGCYD